MNKTIIAGSLAIVFLSACSGNGENNIGEITFQGDTVSVNANSPIISRIKTETVALEPFSSEFRTVGTVQAETGHYAEVGVPFNGRITSTRVRLGSRVRAGETLFEMSSPEFLDASKQYFQNQRTYEKAMADYNRKKHSGTDRQPYVDLEQRSRHSPVCGCQD